MRRFYALTFAALLSLATVSGQEIERKNPKLSDNQLEKTAKLLPPSPIRLVTSNTDEPLVLVFENFDKFTKGSEANPDSQDCVDRDGVMNDELTQVPGWGGTAVYQAGGVAYLGMTDGWYGPEPGFITTPICDMSANGGVITVAFRARSAQEGADDNVAVELYDLIDPYPLNVSDLPITTEWQEFKISLENATNECFINFHAFNAGLYIDDIRITAEGSPAPTGLTVTGYNGTSAHLAWDAVEGADYYLMNVSYMDYYNIYYPIKDKRIDTNSFDITELDPNNDYSYQVAVVKNGIRSPYSGKVSIQATLAPNTIQPTDYDGEKFTAAWSTVPSAESYKLNVYYNDVDADKKFIKTPVMTEVQTTETSYLVNNLPIPTVYFFNVFGLEPGDIPTKTSLDQIVMPESLAAPEATGASNITDNSFTANWKTAPGANAYKVWLYTEHTATTAETYVHTETDFANVVSEEENATLENPDRTYFDGYYTDNKYGLFGWYINMEAIINGALGLDNSFGEYGAKSYLYSPLLDLTPFDGKATLTLNLASADCTTAIVTLAIRDEKGTFTEIDKHEVPVTSTFTEQTIQLQNGTNACYVLIYQKDGKSLLFEDLKLTVDMPQGSKLRKEIANQVLYGIQSTSFTFENIDTNVTDALIYNVFGAIITPNNGQITSDYSNDILVNETSGINNTDIQDETNAYVSGATLYINNPKAAPIYVYTVDGKNIFTDNTGTTTASFELSAKGIYIVRIGTTTVKVIN